MIAALILGLGRFGCSPTLTDTNAHPLATVTLECESGMGKVNVSLLSGTGTTQSCKMKSVE
jgi:hypothetical protein